MNQKLKRIYPVYFILLYLVWTVKTLVIQPAVNTMIPEDSVLSVILFDWILKNLFWTVPALILINQFDDHLYLKKQELFRNPVNWKEVFPIIAGEIGFCILNSIVAHQGFYLNPDSLIPCIGFLFVGITEEFVFRGFLLNAVITKENQNFAVGINALLFLSIHFPIWILNGNFIRYFANFGFMTIILLSIFFSWSMLKFRNIWIPVILHMLWDILVTLLN